jgi:hypothetical protein
VTTAEDTTPDGVVELRTGHAGDQDLPVYVLTGLASDGGDVLAKYGRRSGSPHHIGAEFVLTVGEERYQVWHGGRASEVVENSRVTVTGALELVGEYEWENFRLVDTRGDWTVRQVMDLGDGDVWVDLSRS